MRNTAGQDVLQPQPRFFLPYGGILGGLPLGVPVNRLSGQEVPREGHQLPQPTDAFYEMARVGHYCLPGFGCYPPSMV